MVYENSNSTAAVGESSSEAMMNDITGTTIYVVCVLLIIPLAGLVAWGIRYAVRKKVGQNDWNSTPMFYQIYVKYIFFLTI